MKAPVRFLAVFVLLACVPPQCRRSASPAANGAAPLAAEPPLPAAGPATPLPPDPASPPTTKPDSQANSQSAPPPALAETVERTRVDGVVKSITEGSLLTTLSGATYEVMQTTHQTAMIVAPKITVMLRDGQYQVMLEQLDKLLNCRQIQGPRREAPPLTEWEAVESTTIPMESGSSLKKGGILRTTSGSDYEIVDMTEHAIYAGYNSNSPGEPILHDITISKSAGLYKAVVKDRSGNAELLCKALGRESPSAAPGAAPFKDPQRCLVIINAGEARGSGFLAELGGKRYLITNEHVLRAGSPLTASTMHGETLVLDKLELCNDRDLVRISLRDQSLEALSLAVEPPARDEVISVYGNREGQGVVRVDRGKVLGVGPALVETDAPFVEGNSGSPLMNDKREVVGVATYMVARLSFTVWMDEVHVKPTDIRRFATRIPEDPKCWTAISSVDYEASSSALRALETYCIDLRDLVGKKVGKNVVSPTSIDYDYSLKAKRYGIYVAYPRLVAAYAAKYNAAVKNIKSAKADMDKAVGQPGTSRGMKGPGISREAQAKRDRDRLMDGFEHIIKTNQDAVDKAWLDLYSAPAQNVKNGNWRVAGIRKEATQWLENLKELLDNYKPSAEVAAEARLNDPFAFPYGR